jgi:glycolate oxidase iron-sulfur subunit
MNLSDLTAQCIRCGFCIESCPTFVQTGHEEMNPRGRIYLVKSVEEGKLTWEDVKPSLDACLGCRACETACPSGVKYGEILEAAREQIANLGGDRATRLLLDGVTSPVALKMQLALAGLSPGARLPKPLSMALSGEEAEAEKPIVQSLSSWSPLDEADCAELKGEVYLLEGCAMRVLFPRVHEATRRLLRRVGFTVRESKAGCCGAMHAHAGLTDEAHERSLALLDEMPDDLPVIVNSAGCGSMMKGLDRGLKPLAERTFDASEFLLSQGLAGLLEGSSGIEKTVAYHDACHLAHGQQITQEPRELLAAIPGAGLKELPESSMCCGSAGTYNLTQPKLARQLLERKWANFETTGADFLVSGNPGCHAWLAQAAREKSSDATVLHTMELLEASFSGLDGLGLA